VSDYRLFVNDERTVLVRIWSDGQAETATREDPSHTWGPPVALSEEGVPAATASSKGQSDKTLYECPSGQHGTSESPGICGVVLPWGCCEEQMVPVTASAPEHASGDSRKGRDT
jgi:hypothetical protein